MYANNLTAVQKDKLSSFEVNLHDRINRQNEDEQFYADLTGLYTDIIFVLSKSNRTKAHVIFEYAALLCQELSLHCGETAYIMGLEGKDASADEVMSKFQLHITDEKKRIDVQIQNAHSMIIDLLGDSKGLLSDFTQTFNTVHGVTKNHLTEYITLGQTDMEGVA